MRHPRRPFLFPLLAVAGLLAVPVRAPGQLVTRFEVRETVLSPDGDGRQDSTLVRYALADTALEVSVVIFEADSVTPVDTLLAPAPDTPLPPPGNRDFYWKGRRFDGSAAPEGAYIVTLRAIGKSDPDTTLSLPIFIDVTAPRVQILSVIPNPYAPGLPGAGAVNISHIVSDTSPVSPGRIADRLEVAFQGPSGAPVTATVVTTPPFTGEDGSYVSSWDPGAEAQTLADGEYQTVITVTDAAGHTARASYHFEIDNAPPTVRVTSLPDNARVRAVPDSLRGRAFDRHGVDSLYVQYPSSPYQRVTQTRLLADTLHFAVALADSVLAEGPFRLDFRAVDAVGRSAEITYTLTWDVSIPVAPVLDPFSGAWHAPRYPLSGTAAHGGDLASIVRVFHNGALVDSVSTVVSERFTVDVPLVVGRNEFFAVQRDGAGNVSAPSNIVVVTFKSAAGVFFPVPFPPGGSFQVNADRTASAVTLRVFDVAGDLVTFFEDDAPRRYYTFRWNGRNSSDRRVRRGPLVVVATIEHEDGTREVLREVFLFDSSPE